ncbi:MAG: amidohydrolase family protein [Gemmatimonadota bacterium]|nr:amidohydrolase family protein [Gemmatimonadota bacterium]
MRPSRLIRVVVAAAALPQVVTALAPAVAAAQIVAIRGGTVYPVSSPPIEGATVLIRDGAIAAVGADVSVPAGARVVDATGHHVIPGLIDAMSYYGIAGSDLNETASPSTPHLRAIEAYYPFGAFGDGEPPDSPRSEDLLMGGVTTHYIAPADATVIGGQGAVVKAAASTFDGLVLREPAAIDMTIGQRPAATFREDNRSPGTRMAVIAHLREQLLRAQEYQVRIEAWNARPESERSSSPPPARDLGLEALGLMLRGEIPARIQANRTTEIREALELAEEFGFHLILDSGISADAVAAELASAGVPVVLGPISHPFVSGEEIPDRDEYPSPDERRATRLQEAGVAYAIASFSRSFGSLGPAGSGKWLLLDAAMAAGYGLSEAQVLRAITLSAAEILGVEDRVGSVEPGKDADVVILDGPPLSVTSWVERVFVDGVEVFVREP